MAENRPGAGPDKIKTMKLYHQVERIFVELEALGFGETDPVDVDTLCTLDQYHYLGTEAVDEAVCRIGITGAMHVLEVGGGIGGPSRYLAHSTGCRITALELQPDLDATARRLTKRCGLSDRVRHLCGDVLLLPRAEPPYDALVSWLTFLHIPDRKALYRKCFDCIRPGARMYVEDYFELGPLSVSERALLSEQVYCNHLPTLDDYRSDLEQAGFEEIELVDMTSVWTEFVMDRHARFRASRARHVCLHGIGSFQGLDDFYSTVARLFEGGNLGGIAFVATRPG
ncbi:MAG: methyltransferase domain-containing protein [Gammaproteobacteria bacterium]|nr:methyltransferase domain-containing protein [Gammaproteobacteria bacterium]